MDVLAEFKFDIGFWISIFCGAVVGNILYRIWRDRKNGKEKDNSKV